MIGFLEFADGFIIVVLLFLGVILIASMLDMLSDDGEDKR